MSMYEFYVWCDGTRIGQGIRDTTWAFPLIETIHILSLTVLLGSILMLDARLLDLALRKLSPAQMAKELGSYINASLSIALLTGILLFLSEARKAYENAAFRPKMIFLFLAIVYYYSVHRKLTATDAAALPAGVKAAAALSLLLWFGVGIAGRAIGFV